MFTIPASYQDWMDCFHQMEIQPVRKEDLLLMEQGELPAGGYIANQFQPRVVQTVDVMLKRYVKRFNQTLKESMEMGDFESIPFLCQRLRKEMEYCYFFRHILFLDDVFVKQLQEEVDTQSAMFWKQVLQEMERIHKESFHTGLEDCIYALKRICKNNGV